MAIIDEWEAANAKGKSYSFTVFDNEGRPVACEMLFSFESDGKTYIVYTDNSVDADGNVQVYASILDPDNPRKLIPIETREEWNMVHDLLRKLVKQSRNEQD